MAQTETPSKRKKLSRWIALVLVLLIITGGVLVGHKWLERRRWLPYARGRMLLEGGQPAEAMHEFRKALERDPGNADAYRLLVRSLASLNDYDAAQAELGNASQFGVSSHQREVMRAQLLFLKARYRLRTTDEPGLALCDSILAEEVKPAAALLAEHAEGADDPGRAFSLLGDVYSLSRDLQNRKARLLDERRRLSENLDKPEEALARRRDLEATNAEAVADAESATAAYERAIKVAPRLAAPRLILASWAVRSWVPDLARAHALLDPLLKREPGHLRARLTLADAARRLGRYDEATAQLDAIGEGTDEPRVLLLRTQILVDQKRWQEALPLAKRLTDRQSRNPAARFLYAAALQHMNRSAEAAGLLQPVAARLGEDGRWPELNCLLSEALLATGNLEQARAAFRRADRMEPKVKVSDLRRLQDIIRAKYDALRALAASEDLQAKYPAEAADHAEQVLTLNPADPELFDLAVTTEAKAFAAAQAAAAKELEVAKGQTEDRETKVALATGKLDAAKKDHLKAQESLVVLHADGLLRKQQPQEALQVCSEQIENAPDPSWGPRVRLMKARLLARTGAFREAIAAYEAARRDSTDMRPALELAALHFRMHHLAEARAVYEELLKVRPGEQEVMARLLGVLVLQGDGTAVRSLLARARQEGGADAEQALLVGLAVQQGQFGAASDLASSLAKARPDDPLTAVMLAQLMWEAGRLDEARQAFDTVLARWPTLPPAYRRGLLDLQQGRAADAVELYRQAQEKLPAAARSSINVDLALALQVGGQVDEATAKLEGLADVPAIETASRGLIQWYLAVLAAGRGDVTAALDHNARVTQSELGGPDERQAMLRRLSALPEAARLEAAAALNLMVAFNRERCISAGVSEVERVAELLPGEPLAACWRAAATDKQGRHEEAVAIYEEAISTNPNLLSAYRLLARSQADAGDGEAAVATLEAALQHADPAQAASIEYRLGGLHSALGQAEQATAAYQAAANDPIFGPAALNDMAYLTVEQHGDLQAALGLAERSLDMAPDRPQTLDTLGWIHLQMGDVDEAVGYLERAKAGLPGMPTVRFHLGLAYLQAGRSEDARAEFEEALAISASFAEAEQARAALAQLSS